MPHPLFDKYYPDGHPAKEILVLHSQRVRDKALTIAQKHPELIADEPFINESALLHDIGIFLTHAPAIGCQGDFPYLCHGYLGREILENEGMPRHALVCERHTGVGLSHKEIVEQNLPLPVRDMLPVSIEEQIICFADTFFSKSKTPEKELQVKRVKEKLMRFGEDKGLVFDRWCEMFL